MMRLQAQCGFYVVAILAILLAILAALPDAASAQQAAPAPGATPPNAIAPSGPAPGRGVAPPSLKPPAVKPPAAPIAPIAPIAQDLVGLDVFSSDGIRVGEVRAVDTGPSGDIVTLHMYTGGFLGFGGRIVAIPQGKFMRSGQSVRLDLDSDEVTGLPEVR